MARSCTASPTTATSRASTPIASAEGRDHARVGLRAEPRIAAHREIEEVEDVVAGQRRLEAAGGVVGGKAEAQAAPLQLDEGLARASTSAECTAPPRRKIASMPAARSGGAAPPRRAAKASAMSSTLPAASGEPGVMRSVAGSCPPSRSSSAASPASPLAANSGHLAVDRHPGAPVVDDGAVLVEQDAADRHSPRLRSMAVRPRTPRPAARRHGSKDRGWSASCPTADWPGPTRP